MYLMYLHVSEYEGDPVSIFCSTSLVYLHAKPQWI